MDAQDSQRDDLVSRVFENRAFQAGWSLFLFIVVLLGWPIRNAVLVLWVYGSDAYFHRGMRVLPGKPVRFSSGIPAPALPDIVTGAGFFFVTTLGLTTLVLAALKFYERHFSRKSVRK